MNREVFPGGIYPLAGDVQSTAGQQSVTVIGIQGVPVENTPPSDQSRLVYQASTSQWQPTPIANDSISVNGVCISDDYDITVNAPVGSNGTPVQVNGSLV